MVVSRADYLQQTQTVSASGSERSINVPDIRLSSSSTAKPVIEWIRPNLSGLLLPGWGIVFSGQTRVNWNGNNPGVVRIYANGSEVGALTGAGPDYSVGLDVDTMFTPSLQSGRNRVSAVATSAAGVNSVELSIELVVLPVPNTLAAFLIDPSNIGRDGNKLHLELTVPSVPVKKMITLPIIGKFGVEIQAAGEFDYHLNTGHYAFDIGGSTGDGGATIYFGDTQLTVDIGAQGEGVASPTQGIRLETLSMYAGLAYEDSFSFPVASVLDLFGPGITAALSRIPFLADKLEPVSLTMWVKPDVSGLAYFDLVPEIGFDRFTLEGKLRLDLGYEADLVVAKVKIYVGGEPSVAFQIPGDPFKQIGFRAYAGFEASNWALQLGPVEYVFVDYVYPANAAERLSGASFHDIGTGYGHL